MWIMQFNKTIQGSLNNSQNAAQQNNNLIVPFANLENSLNPNIENARTKDTDNDGLSDWDELYVHKTSPYIEDSDSDGYTDGQEVGKGDDPNCPRGQNCGAENVYENTDEQPATPKAEQGISLEQFGNLDLNNMDAQTLEMLQQAQGQVNNLDTSNINNLNDDNLQNILNGQSDAATLRSMLMSAGIDANMLNQLSDDDLMKAYKETLGQ